MKCSDPFGFVKSIGCCDKKMNTVTAVFTDGTRAEYTTDIIRDLESDRSVDCIYDEDGVVLYSKN